MTAVAQAPAAADVRDAGRRVEALLDELTAAGPDVVAAGR